MAVKRKRAGKFKRMELARDAIKEAFCEAAERGLGGDCDYDSLFVQAHVLGELIALSGLQAAYQDHTNGCSDNRHLEMVLGVICEASEEVMANLGIHRRLTLEETAQ
jgi:hypothetical protein